MNRRDLLLLGRRTLGWLVALAAAWPVLSFVAWRPRTTREVRFAGPELADHAGKEGVYLLRSGDGYAALSSVCTHLCCTVIYDERARVFRCPCHRSVYDATGRRLSGPATRDLARLPVARDKDGSLRVEAPL